MAQLMARLTARFGRRAAVVLVGATLGVGLFAGVAWAYWLVQANASTYAAADAIGASAQPTGSANGNTVNLSWPATTTVAGRAVTGYLVNRYAAASGGTAIAVSQGSCAANPVATTGCAETGVPAGTWYYTITPVLGAWRGSESPRGGVLVNADSFTLAWPAGTGSLTAGTATSLTITAKVGGSTDTTYFGTKTIAFSGPGSSPNGTAPSYNGGSSSVTFTNGVATVPVSLYRAESTILTAADGSITGSLPVTVNPAAASQFGLPAIPNGVAGTAFSVTVTALDAYGNTATGYAGGKTLSWSGPGNAPSGTAPSYPGNPVTFTAGVASNLPVTLYLAQSTALTVGDGSIHGTSANFTVSAGSATQFGVPAPAAQTAGSAFNVTVTALDAYKNAATGYAGSKTLTFSGPSTAPDGTKPSYPTQPVTFTGGAATVSITLVKAESTTLTAGDGTISGTSAGFTVNPGSAARLAWSQVSAPSGTVGSPCLFTCTATSVGNNQTVTGTVSVTDTFGNTVSGLGSSHTVSVSTNGGTFTAPTGGSSVTLTISATGPAVSGQFTFKTQNGTWASDTLTAQTAAGTPYTSATATVNRN